MNWIDIIIISCLGLSMVYSLFKGMTREIFSLVAIFSGYLAANYFYEEAAKLFIKFIPNPSFASFAGFFAIFIVVSLTVNIIGRMIKKLIKISHALTLMDRFGGGVIGLLKGVMVISLIIMPLSLLPAIKDQMMSQSKLSPYFLSSSKLLAKLSQGLPMENINTDKAKKMLNRLKSMLNDPKGEDIKDWDNLQSQLKSMGLENLPQPNAHLSKDDKEKIAKIIEEHLNKQ